MTMSRTDHPQNRLAGIHGLRFLAAAMVFVFHLRDVAGVVPFFSLDIYLSEGVRLFFVLSAFSLMYSTNIYISRKDWIRIFVVKRYFRIAPLFYIMAFVGVMMGISGSHTLPEIMMTATFVFNFYPDQVGSLAWGGWTVGVEMVFYALLPMIIGVVTSLRAAIVFLAFAIVVGSATLTAPTPSALPWYYVLMSFPTQLQFFAAGILAYFVYQLLLHAPRPQHQRPAVVFPVLATMALCGWLVIAQPLTFLPAYTERETGYIAALILFGLLTVWQAISPSSIFASRFCAYWGERSYSIYLLHGPILVAGQPLWKLLVLSLGEPAGYLATALIAFTFILSCSWLTYRFIEQPGIKFGMSLYARPDKGPNTASVGAW